MGYEKLSTKLTFYKVLFLSQWKFLIHTILQCMSAKRTSWNEFSSSMASIVICLSTGRKFNFSKSVTIMVSEPGFETVGSKDLTCEDWTLCFLNYALMTRHDYDLTSSLRRGALHGQPEGQLPAVRVEIKVLRSETLAYEQEGIQTHEALTRSKAYCRALEARVAVLETHARRLEWQRQAADDLAV
nr:ribonuclease H-like domain, reverse transcriptase, RNA-dependent DNA polymerase [Tanacetum cinerariifolium]